MRIAVTLLLAVLGGSLLASSVKAQRVRIPGTTVEMTAPPGFRVARTFRGLEDPTAGSTIMVAEYPPDRYADIAAVFASPKTAAMRYESQGVRITRIEPLTVGSNQVPLAVGSQETKGKDLTKYFTVLGGGETNAVLVTFSISEAKPLSLSDVEAVVRSIKLARLPTLDEKMAGLSFTFKVAAPFRVANVPDRATANLVTFDGLDSTGMKPVASIRRLNTAALPSESEKMAEQRLQEMVANATITERMPVTFAGGEGYYIAEVAGKRTVLEFLRVLPGGTLIEFVAVGETTAMADAADAVKEIAASVDLR